jgi:hypothetical protein
MRAESRTHENAKNHSFRCTFGTPATNDRPFRYYLAITAPGETLTPAALTGDQVGNEFDVAILTRFFGAR